MSKFYLTTPLYYPNARPHVGSAYTTIVCDVIARYKRMCGYDVAYLTGTDEHGEKLQRAAEAAGMQPAEFVAEKRKLFIELWKKLGIQYTHFVYTDQPEHVASVQRLIRLAQKNEPGVIYKGQYQGRYCVYDERYVSDGTDPANCDICGRPAELINEENYFFRLSAFQERLLKLYQDDPEFVQPEYRRNEVISFVKGGLRDISISRRRLKWGIPWPDDPDQVVYVWYDALAGYMTGVGYAEGEEGSDDFKKLWPADLHMIGKDILRFHAIYWPAFLMAAGLPLPKAVFAHGWIYYEQDKMSKSKGNVVYPDPIVDALDSFGAPGNDALRYYLLRDTPFGQDANFSYEGLINRYNSDLANDLGNLANRTVTMINRYCDGRVPKPESALAKSEEDLQETFFGKGEQKQLVADYKSASDAFLMPVPILRVWDGISAVNSYLVEQQPWKLAASNREEDRSRLETVLYTAADLIRTIAVLLHPVIPDSTAKLWVQLGCDGHIRDQKFEDLKWQSLQPGTKVGKPEPVFPRLDKAATLARLNEFAEEDRKRNEAPVAKEKKTVETPPEKKGATGEQPRTTPEVQSGTGLQSVKEGTAGMATPQTAPQISIDDFAKVEMRVGEIISAEPIPKADKLLKLLVDIGTEVRQVCAGIAEYYKPEQLIGMKVVVVTNLQPRKLRGVESNGMIVAASVGEEGRPVLVTFKEDVPKGARLR
ncbi:MAG TPA: methionine--tRNA ligase [Terriglobia bacterium]|nr:methionine--tRNA ligase [Terriglobia bacterium]